MTDWFYMKGANKHGPVSASKLRELAQSGQLLPTDLVWKEGMNDWKRARKIDGLFDGKPMSGIQPATTPASASKKRPPAPPSNLLGSSEVKRPSPPPTNLLGNTAAKPASPPTNTKPAWTNKPAPPTQPAAANSLPIAAPAGPDGVLHCAFCQGEMSDDPTSAGQEVFCPHCSRHFRMPVAKQTASRPASQFLSRVVIVRDDYWKSRSSQSLRQIGLWTWTCSASSSAVSAIQTKRLCIALEQSPGRGVGSKARAGRWEGRRERP